ncbi:AAA family ATPase [Nonomuraea gerenzanensis]|uniref:Putative transcriptional regulator n=1 Tax=Nonomuraea gerenzanensis TaxID=93944 RepID=A0A1M4E5X1_9ACTN|nr:helix-turn-helix transcriptional regulator [Nonomuraea gerenzanensis]UBU16339.1 AAA family ATPase [Nonomuraea gerenzanensis]SBO94158.1 putative transcriptional regulator [Nonomuraea gerenzanensis]
MLYGRAAEQAVIDQLLLDTLEGRPRALVVRGEAGVGKSALLDHAAANADAQVLRVTGVESEAELPFAALHLLLRPALDRVGVLPPQQSEALLGALGLGGATRGDRFLVGLATLSLLVELSAQRPLVCLVDDAQWLDGESADALLFATRRLHAEPVAVLFAARTGARLPAGGLPELHLGSLAPEAARQLLAAHAGTLPPAVRDQVVAEAQGNPLALLELPRMLSPAATGPLPFCLGNATPVTSRVLATFRDRIAALPESTRTCLLVAALDDRGELSVLAHALGLLGASLDDAAPAEWAGLIRITPEGVTFHHPLVRAAVLLATGIAARMAAHRALAEAVDDDRRAWHLAAVTLRPDEQVAMEMERLALRAQRRGGQAAVSAAYARAAELSPGAADAARRYTRAASAAVEAGLGQRATELVTQALRRAEVEAPGEAVMALRGAEAHASGEAVMAPRGAEAEAPGEAVMAELAEVRARLAVEAGRPLEAARLLMEGAQTGTDHLTRLSLLSMAGFYTWTSAAHPDQIDLTRRIEELTPTGEGVTTVVKGINQDFRTVLEGGTSVASTVAARVGQVPFDLRLIVAFQAVIPADREVMLDAAAAMVRECRAEGRLGRMPQAMTVLAIAQLMDGRHPAARDTAAEGQALAADVGQPVWGSYLAGVHAWLSAVAGAEEEYTALADEAFRLSEARRWMPSRCWAEYAGALLELGQGRYEAVLDQMDRAMAGPSRHAFIWRYAWPDYVEAAVRAGAPERALEALRRHADWAESTEQPGPLAVQHRARALMAAEHCAEQEYQRALELHLRHEQPFDQARTRLVYGEWLRRHQRRSEARPHLEAAMEAFDRLGAAPWSARAAGELRAAGVSVRSGGAGDLMATLTPQELQVVRLAVTGASNREIAAQLFLSPRTVASHLYKAFPKLGVASRAELARLDHTRR